VKIRIEYKLSSDQMTSHRELNAIEAALRACFRGEYIHESWRVDGGIIYELRKKG